MFFIKIITALLFLLFFNASSYAEENISDCLTKEESSALSFRILQTKYMVSALSCNGVLDDYNHFVEKYSSKFIKNGNLLRNYFKRCYGNKANSNLDKFITKMANHFSFLSLENHYSFCEENHKSMLKFLNSTNNNYDFIENNLSLFEDFALPKCQRN